MGKFDFAQTIFFLLVVLAVLLFLLVQEGLQGHEASLPPLALVFGIVMFLILAMVWNMIEDLKNNMR